MFATPKARNPGLFPIANDCFFVLSTDDDRELVDVLAAGARYPGYRVTSRRDQCMTVIFLLAMSLRVLRLSGAP